MFNADKITRDIHAEIDRHLFWLLQSRYIGGAEIAPLLQVEPADQSPISDAVRLLVNAANNEIDRTTADASVVASVHEAVQSLCETLFATALENAYSIPGTFWQSEIGRQMITAAQAWARGTNTVLATDDEEWLTSKQVAEISGGNERIIRDILNDPTDRATFFPNARAAGTAKRKTWMIPKSDAVKFTPRPRGRQTRKDK